jgi:hypothetical protein
MQFGQSALLLQLAAQSTQRQGGGQLFKKLTIKFDNSALDSDNQLLIMRFTLEIASFLC